MSDDLDLIDFAIHELDKEEESKNEDTSTPEPIPSNPNDHLSSSKSTYMEETMQSVESQVLDSEDDLAVRTSQPSSSPVPNSLTESSGLNLLAELVFETPQKKDSYRFDTTPSSKESKSTTHVSPMNPLFASSPFSSYAMTPIDRHPQTRVPDSVQSVKDASVHEHPPSYVSEEHEMYEHQKTPSKNVKESVPKEREEMGDSLGLDLSYSDYDDIMSDALLMVLNDSLEESNPRDEPYEVSSNVPNPRKKRKLPVWMDGNHTLNGSLKKTMLNVSTARSRKRIELTESQDNETKEINVQWIPNPSEILQGRVICFDVETTGFSSEDGIIELGAIEMVDGKRTGIMFQSYVSPKMQVNIFASQVHGLTNKHLSSAPPIDEVLPRFLNWIGDAPLVAHNARFDLRMYDLYLYC